MQEIIIVGYGGHAKSVVDCIERKKEYRIIGYTDLIKKESQYPYLGDDTVLKQYYENGVENVAVGIGYLGKYDIRERIYNNLKEIGFNIPTIVDPSAIISESAVIGEGVFVGKRAVVNSEAIIGKMSIINTGAIIEHECNVGDFTHVAVNATLCGQVNTGIASFVGASATILQCRIIPNNTIIPAGSVFR